MDSLLFLSLFIGIGALYFVIGWWASKGVKTTEDYFLAGRKLGLASVTFTLVATQIGGNLILGSSQEAYRIGWYGLFYAGGMILGFLILGCGFAAKLQSCGVATTAELFEVKYNSTLLKKIASALSIISLFGVLISMVVSSRALLTGLGISGNWMLLIFWVFVIAYTMVGGLRAVVMTDIVQVLFIMLSIGSIFIYTLWYQPASFFSLGDLFAKQVSFSTESFSIGKEVGVFFMPALFSLIEQDLAQRFFAARSKWVAGTAALLASVCLCSFAVIPVYFGMQAQLLGISVPEGAAPFIPVIRLITNDLTFAFVVCGIFAAITSTADSLLCAISSNIAQDFNFSWTNIKNKIALSQAITFFVGIAALLSSYIVSQRIVSITISSYELLASTLLIPLLFSFYVKQPRKQAAFYAATAGLFGFVIFRIYPLPFPKELATLTLATLGYVIGMKK